MIADPKSIAEWMLGKVRAVNELYQSEAVADIESQFGSQFVYTNDNGNPAIRKDILEEFRQLSKDSVVWERSGRYWRLREETDIPGRRQVD